MPSRRKDINEATQQDLEQIPQMSSARAETIIHYRDQHGPFTDMNQLSDVPGIGETMAQQVAEFFSLRSTRSSQRSAEDEGEEEMTEGEEGEEEGQEKTTEENQQTEDQQPRRTGRRQPASSSRRQQQG